MDPTADGRAVNLVGNCYTISGYCFRSCDPIANRINKYLTGPKKTEGVRASLVPTILISPPF